MNMERIIVSLTTYPKRMHTVIQALQTIYAQTRQADEVVLWLAEEQFPEKYGNLPEELLKLVRDGMLTIRWCDDLKPHKKYFYALQEYADALVVTVDDDLRYDENLLEDLYQSYLRHPNAVSAARAHLIILDSNGNPMPYKDWIQETDVRLDTPSMQLFATGGAGALYPPNIFHKELFDKDAVCSTCLWADDLWLKTMELLSNVPVVVARKFQDLRYVPGSQDEALYHQNVNHDRNDEQMTKITAWVNEHYGKDILREKLMHSGVGTDLTSIEEICLHLRHERSVKKEKIRELGSKLKQTYAEKSELNAKLQRTYAEKSELNSKLQRTFAEKSEISKALREVREHLAIENNRGILDRIFNRKQK